MDCAVWSTQLSSFACSSLLGTLKAMLARNIGMAHIVHVDAYDGPGSEPGLLFRGTLQGGTMIKIYRVRVLIVAFLLAAFVLPSMALASSSTTVVKLWVGNNIMTIGGVRQPIDSEGTKPVIVEGRTLVPIRAVIEAFDGSVVWGATERKVTVTLGENALDLWIGKSTATLNGTTLPVDAANPRVIPVIMSGRTMLPLRFVSESLGIDVQYEATTKMITLTYMVDTTPPPPSAPMLVAPGDGSAIVGEMPKLSWFPVAGTDMARIQVLSAGTEVYSKSDLSGTEYAVPAGAFPDGTYTWRVSLHNEGGWGAWSTARRFTLSSATPPSAPQLLTPVNGSVIDSATVVLTWQSVAGADFYRIQVLQNATEVHAASSLNGTAYTVPAGVLASGAYSWQAAAHGPGGWSSWSDAFLLEVRAKLTTSDIAKYVDRMVLIEVDGFEDGKALSASGSGFFISSDGRIVTNYHVIDAATQGTVTVNGGQKYDISSVLGYNKDQDLAVIQISGTGFPICTLGDSSKVAVGDPVVAIGSPLGIQNTVSEGIVSKLWEDGSLQITAPISPGSSGGALFNMYGEVIGVTTWKIRNGENMNLAVPVNLARNLDTALNLTLTQLFQKEYPGTAVLAAPVLLSPAPDAVLSVLTPTLSWTAVPGATKYNVKIWVASTTFPPYVVDEVIATNSFAVPSGVLSSGVRYGWTVFAGNSLGWGAQMTKPGSVYNPAFTVQAAVKLATPVPSSPLDDEWLLFVGSYPQTFRWSGVTGADYYTLWIGTGTSGLHPSQIFLKNVYATSWSIQESDLPAGQIYTWGVMAIDADSAGYSSNWSADRHFSVVDFEGIRLISPSNYSTVYYSPTMSWLPYSGATTYFVDVYRGTSMSGTQILSQRVSGTSYSIPGLTLTQGQTYCWSVNAFRQEYIDGILVTFPLATAPNYILYASP